MHDLVDTASFRPAPSTRQESASEIPPISAEREIHLAVRIKAGDPEAREELVLSNLFLVRNIAAAFRGRNRIVDINDLIQEGNLGLLRAASDFDPESHGNRFVNYAACWIRYRIRRVLAEQTTTIRYPYYLVLLRRRFEKAREQILASNGATPDATDRTGPEFEEVVERMGVEGKRLKLLRSMRDELRSRSISSITDPSHESALAQLPPPQEPLEIAESMERLHAAIRKLTLIESWVLRRRYRLDESHSRASAGRGRLRRGGCIAPDAGLTADGWRTYRELSVEIGMPQHQLRQIERSAITKLQNILEPRDAETTREDARPVSLPAVVARKSA